MARLYLLLFIISLIGGVGYAAYGYYTSTQQRIQTLAENNAKLKVAIEKSDYALLATMVISEIFGLLLIVYSLFNKGKYNLNSRFWVHGTILIIIAGSMTFIWFGFIYLLFKNPI